MGRLLLLSVIFMLFASRAAAASLEDGAKTEGEVVLYSSLNSEQIVTLIDAFKKNILSSSPPSIAAQASASCSAPRRKPKQDGSPSTSRPRPDFSSSS
jgi:hypothetical protein